jgi:hypothetical protein
MTSSTSRRFVVSCLAAVLCAAPATSFAQSLADVARTATTTRKEQPKAGKVYTNDNLRTDITASAPVTPAPAVEGAMPAADSAVPPTPADGSAAPAGPVGDARGQRSTDEAMWRGRITAAREALERSTSFASALQSQINGLTIDFINRDDPEQRAQIEQQRAKAVAELERTQREDEGHRKAIAAIEDEARKAGVPAGWLR